MISLSAPATAGEWWWGSKKPECGSLTAVAEFGENRGGLEMCAYVPDGLSAGRPLVVALHGCTQQSKDYADGPGWTKLADEYQFAVLLPQQTEDNNATTCFNWFEPDDVKRHDAGGEIGEVASIWEMIQKMQTDYETDPNQVYVTGLSAGGAMTTALLAAYPEVFAGGAIIAGIPAGCAQDVAAALNCMNPGKDMSPQEWGDQVRAAAPGHVAGDGVPRVAVWQGSADTTVMPKNAEELIDQWTNIIGIDRVADETSMVSGASYKGYANNSGTILVEEYLVPGMPHGVAVDPANGCGVAAPFILDEGICSSRLIVDFWGFSPE